MTDEEWLTLCETRAKSHGLRVERCDSQNGHGRWLRIAATAADAMNNVVSIWSRRSFILTAGVQDVPPRELVDRAHMVLELVAMTAPELLEPDERKTDDGSTKESPDAPF